MKFAHWPLMGGLLHLVERGGNCAGRSPPRPLLAVPNVTAHPTTVSVLITVLLYNLMVRCSAVLMCPLRRQSWIQHSRLCWKSTVAETGNKSSTKWTKVAVYVQLLLPVLATNRQQLEFDSLSRSTLLPIRSTLLSVCTGPKRHGRLSTKSTVLNSTLSPVCTGLKRVKLRFYLETTGSVSLLQWLMPR